jgi:hypothetical protein
VAENLPAKGVGDQLQELERCLIDRRHDHTRYIRSTQFDTSSPFDVLTPRSRGAGWAGGEPRGFREAYPWRLEGTFRQLEPSSRLR